MREFIAEVLSGADVMNQRYEQLEQGQTVLANRTTDRALIKLAGDMAVYIGRGGRHGLKTSLWHNPFKISKDITNEQAVA